MSTPTACDISLVAIDLDHLEDVEENLEAVEFTVKLSQAPTETWNAEFCQAYQRVPYTLKPPINIDGDRMKVVYLPRYADELPAYFDFLRAVIDDANAETHRTEDIHKSHMQDSRKGTIRDALSQVRLP